LFCNVERELVIEEQDVAIRFTRCRWPWPIRIWMSISWNCLRLHVNRLDLTDWREMVDTLIHSHARVNWKLRLSASTSACRMPTKASTKR
jgi:hypothetical protein